MLMLLTNRPVAVLRAATCGLLLALVSLCAGPLRADDFDRESLKLHDRVLLRNGQLLQGTLQGEETRDGRKVLRFETRDGEQLLLDMARLVQKVTPVDEIDVRYNEALDKIRDTAQDHHDMVTWLEEQPGGSIRFKDQILFHQQRIMVLDPNDAAVRKRLGYKFVEEEGRWVKEEHYWQSLGYVKRGTSWVPEMQILISDQYELQRQAEGERKSQLAVWRRNLKRMSPAAAQESLLAMADPEMIPLLFAEAIEEPDPRIQSLFVEAFGHVKCDASASALVYFIIERASDRALDLLLQDGFDRARAAADLAPFLANPDNAKIQRAAFAMGELGTTNRLLSLADALVTEHVVKPADQPGRMTQRFDNQGNLGGFSFGGNSKPTQMKFRNEKVLEALKKITEQDFGYSTEAWQRWYVDNFSDDSLPVRRR